ncbi:MAG: M28 family peptidase [Bacteroidales bacterium]|nr:M28 family peptidase [Bacteroidales bacterium]
MKKIILSLSFLFLVAITLWAQDTTQVRQYIRDLSSKEMHGRGYAYNGDSIAAAYIADQFTRMGIENRYLPYGFSTYAMEGPVSAVLDKKALIPWTDYALAPYSPSADSTYLLLPITPTILMNEKALSTFQKKHAQVLPHALLYIDMTRAEGDPADITRWLQKLRLNPIIAARGFVLGVKDIPVWSFNYARKTFPYILAYVKADLIRKSSKQLQLSYTNRFDYHPTQDVIGIVPGTSNSDSIIIIGGHYDHLGQMGDAVLFPGAHDNASGTATVLDMANYFKEHPLPYTTYFVLFSGEEAGLLGSFAFVDNPPVDLSKVKFMLNLDLLCGGDDGFTVVNSDGEGTKDFFNTLVSINEKEHLATAVKPRKNTANSDHYPFSKKGVPAVFIYVMGGHTGGYHQPDDTNENASLSAYPGIFKLLVKGLESIH